MRTLIHLHSEPRFEQGELDVKIVEDGITVEDISVPSVGEFITYGTISGRVDSVNRSISERTGYYWNKKYKKNIEYVVDRVENVHVQLCDAHDDPAVN